MACKKDAPNIENAKYIGAFMVDIGFQDKIKKRVHLLSLLNYHPELITQISFDQGKIVLTDLNHETIAINKDDLFNLPNNKILIKIYSQVVEAVDHEIREMVRFVARSKTIPAKTKQRHIVQLAELASINQKLREAQKKKRTEIYLPLQEAARLSLTVSYINNLRTLNGREEGERVEDKKLYEWNKLYAGLTSGETGDWETLEDKEGSSSEKIDLPRSLKKIQVYDELLYQQLQTAIA